MINALEKIRGVPPLETRGTISIALLTDFHHNSVIKLIVHCLLEGRGRIYRSGQTHDIKTASC